MRKLLRESRVRIWLALAGTSFILILTAYTLVQQSTRLAVNDLPVATAQVVKHQLESGSLPSDVVPTIKSDLRNDSTTFVIVTDNSEHVLAGSATLDGNTSLPPAGTFTFTKDHGSDHFTWQPKSGVRLATYMTKYGNSPNDGFVITGQSLKQAEDRIGTYGWLALAGWLAILAWISLLLLLPYANNSSKKSSKK